MPDRAEGEALVSTTAGKRPRGGPDGGNGGKGGSIGFVPDSRYKDFSHLKKKTIFKAKSGESGSGQLKSGRKGKDLLIPLPLGVLLKSEKGKLLKDLSCSENPFVFLKGGNGGKGNVFYKSSVNQAPSQFQKGQAGEKAQVILELKPIIDAAVIGRANTGKSTFFNQITGGRSPVGDYACTTLAPHYGLVRASFSCSLMDIPGIPSNICEKNNSLAFLRLMGRAKALLIFLSIEPGQESPQEILKDIERALKAFDEKYPEKKFAFKYKKRIIILSKADLLHKEILQKEIESLKKKALPLSSKTGKGIEEVLDAIRWNLKNG